MYFRLKTETEKPFTPDEKPVKADKKDRPGGKGFTKGMSPKRAAETELYAKEAKEFIKGKMCAVYPTKKAVETHHIRGRLGKLLLDQRYWLPVSRAGHKYIHDNVNWSYEKGFMVSRLKKD